MTLIIQKPIHLAKNYEIDVDAFDYLQRVEAADGQTLEADVRTAVDNFVRGCKDDGIWWAIRASCILAGARTRTGALVPLAGPAPQSFNFVDANYERKTGLKGDGSTKYLNSNYAANLLVQNNQSIAVYGSDLDVSSNSYIGSSSSLTAGGVKNGQLFSTTSTNFFFSNQFASGSNQSSNGFGTMQSKGFAGSSRSGATTTIARRNGINVTDSTNASIAPSSHNYFIFGNNNNQSAGLLSSARLAFYSIGASLDLALLDARVTDLINAFAAAIP